MSFTESLTSRSFTTKNAWNIRVKNINSSLFLNFAQLKARFLSTQSHSPPPYHIVTIVATARLDLIMPSLSSSYSCSFDLVAEGYDIRVCKYTSRPPPHAQQVTALKTQLAKLISILSGLPLDSVEKARTTIQFDAEVYHRLFQTRDKACHICARKRKM